MNTRVKKPLKKSVNVSLAPEMLERAREHHLNLSEVLAQALQEIFREQERQRWLNENRKKIASINQYTEENGSFSDYQRAF